MAKVVLPESIVDASVYIDGLGFIGTVDKDSIKFPEIEEIEESIKAGGFEQSYGTGVFKKLEFELTLKEINSVIYTSMATGLSNGKGVSLVVKGSTIQDGTKKSFIATIQGKPAVSLKGAETTIKGTATLFIYEYDGEELCSFDTKNMIAKIGGVDYLETLRTHIA